MRTKKQGRERGRGFATARRRRSKADSSTKKKNSFSSLLAALLYQSTHLASEGKTRASCPRSGRETREASLVKLRVRRWECEMLTKKKKGKVLFQTLSLADIGSLGASIARRGALSLSLSPCSTNVLHLLPPHVLGQDGLSDAKEEGERSGGVDNDVSKCSKWGRRRRRDICSCCSVARRNQDRRRRRHDDLRVLFGTRGRRRGRGLRRRGRCE